MVHDAVTFKVWRDAWNDASRSKAITLAAGKASRRAITCALGASAGAASVAIISLATGGLSTVPALLVWQAGSALLSYGVGAGVETITAATITEMCAEVERRRGLLMD